jgi:hypothetical protein
MKKSNTSMQKYSYVKLLPLVHICTLLEEVSKDGKSKDITFSI